MHKSYIRIILRTSKENFEAAMLNLTLIGIEHFDIDFNVFVPADQLDSALDDVIEPYAKRLGMKNFKYTVQ